MRNSECGMTGSSSWSAFPADRCLLAASSPTYSIQVRRIGVGRRRLDERLIRRAVRETLRSHGCARAHVDLALVSDDKIALLNWEYLGHRGPTDVITFPLSLPGDEALEGDVVISVDTAARESSARGQPLMAEVLLYAVHGVLHLLGYDDKTSRGAAAMHAEEERTLALLGFAGAYAAPRRPVRATRGRR
jgi:probable rRNA maturation factor